MAEDTHVTSKRGWRRRHTIASALFIVLAGMALFVSAALPQSTQTSDSPVASSQPSGITDPETQPVRRFTVRVENDTVPRGLPITVNQGDHVVIVIDIGPQKEADFQIPGYTLSTTVERGSKPEFEFTADKKGAFEVVFSRREPWEGEVLRKVVGTLYVR